jgi:hypothetical protein
MNSYSTHNDVTDWEFCRCRRKNKTAEKRAGASSATGVALGALNEARNLTSTNSDTAKKQHEQSQHIDREDSNDKRMHKNLTMGIQFA